MDQIAPDYRRRPPLPTNPTCALTRRPRTVRRRSRYSEPSVYLPSLVEDVASDGEPQSRGKHLSFVPGVCENVATGGTNGVQQHMGVVSEEPDEDIELFLDEESDTEICDYPPASPPRPTYRGELRYPDPEEPSKWIPKFFLKGKAPHWVIVKVYPPELSIFPPSPPSLSSLNESEEEKMVRFWKENSKKTKYARLTEGKLLYYRVEEDIEPSQAKYLSSYGTN